MRSVCVDNLPTCPRLSSIISVTMYTHSEHCADGLDISVFPRQSTPYYQPAREVDFYDFLELPNGPLGLVVGNATCKGIPRELTT